MPSPKVATYDLKPEMSAYEVTDKLVAAIESGQFDLVVVNFANTDMVGPHRRSPGRHQGGGSGRSLPRPRCAPRSRPRAARC